MNLRVLMAFLIAPISFGLLVAISFFFGGTVWIVVLAFSAFFGYPIALVLGVPAYLILKRIGANGFLTYSLIGGVLGLGLIAGLVVWPAYAENQSDLTSLLLPERMRQMGILGFAGFWTMAVFWLIARPDRSVVDTTIPD